MLDYIVKFDVVGINSTFQPIQTSESFAQTAEDPWDAMVAAGSKYSIEVEDYLESKGVVIEAVVCTCQLKQNPKDIIMNRTAEALMKPETATKANVLPKK